MLKNKFKILLLLLIFLSCEILASEKATTNLSWRTDNVETENVDSIGSAEFEATEQGLAYTIKINDSSPYGIISYHDSDRVYDGDYVKISVVTKKDDKKIFVFLVNRSGTTADYKNDSAGRVDSYWTSKWYSKSISDDYSYTVKLNIPWSALQVNFNDFDGKTSVVVVDNNQKLLNNDRYKSFINFNYNKNNPCFECQMLPIPKQPLKNSGQELNDQDPAKEKVDVEYEPYIVALKGSETSFDAGLDVKISKDSNFALFTINPDYSSVETDGFYNTENNLYAVQRSENRLFFQKIGSALSSNLDLLYTRSIINPTFGAQYHYSKGSYDFDGFISDDSTTTFTVFEDNGSYIKTVNQNSLNFGSKIFFNKDEKSYYGAMLLQRTAQDYRNSVVSINGANTIKSSTIAWQVAASDTNASQEYGTKNGNGYAAFADWSLDKSGYRSYTSFSYVDDNFQSSLGSIGSPGGSLFHLSNYSKDKLKFLDKISFSLYGNVYYDEKINIEQTSLQIGSSAKKGKYSASISVSAGKDYDNVINSGKTSRASSSLSVQFEKCSLSFVYSIGESIDYINSTTGKNDIKSISQYCQNGSFDYSAGFFSSKFESNHQGSGYSNNSMSLSSSWLINKSNELSFDAEFFQLNSTMNTLRPVEYTGVILTAKYKLSLGRRANILAGANYYSEDFNGINYNEDTFYIKWLGSF